MYCNEQAHYYLNEYDYAECPFCYKRIQNSNPIKFTCCNNMEITNNRSCFICKQCASVHEYETAREYIDFHENRYRIKRKSVYNRKYHLQNKITNLCITNNISISYKDKQKILDVFKIIDDVIPIINCGKRKRMIKIDFILNKFFHSLNINIKISQKDSKQTLLYNQKYWDDINSLIGKEIQSILIR